MRNSLLSKLKIFFTSRQNISKSPQEESHPYKSLSPSDEAEGFEDYNKALLWAISNSKEKAITNIALTGPYGSGKSSIIRTFKKQNTQYELLEISLATFPNPEHRNSSSASDTDKKGEGNDKNTEYSYLNQIELSILNQIFHRDKKDKIGILSDSRFHKIQETKPKYIIIFSFLLLLWLTSLYYLVNEEGFKVAFRFLKNSFWNEWRKEYLNWFNYAILIYIAAGCLTLVYLIFKILYKIKLNKVNIFDAEIEISSSANKSILNQYIEEIIYFFERNDNYSIVVIEDLDRFERPEIFTKLREINYILNTSSKIKDRKIIFLYAVRDDMFKEKDRAKFFDFIIPVIPIINYSNSRDKLININKLYNYGWDKYLIQDIAFFVDDMRLLYNICNEFNIYRLKISGKLDPNKMLAILVYKNLYPRDFSELSENKGVLAGYFQKKATYLSIVGENLNIRLNNLKENINSLEKEYSGNIKELRSIYIYNYILHFGSGMKFYFNQYPIQLESLFEDENFNRLINNELQYRLSDYDSYRYLRGFDIIEEKVNSDRKYLDRYNILVSDKTKLIRDNQLNLIKVEKELREINRKNLKDLLNDDSIAINSDEENRKINEFLLLLLRKGYIDETYLDYISIFHEGTFTRQDHEFILTLKLNRKPLPYDYKLYNHESVIDALDQENLTSKYVLNFGLIEYLITKHRNKNIAESIFRKQPTLNFNLQDFILKYFDSGNDKVSFATMLMKVSPHHINIIAWTNTLDDIRKRNIIGELLNNWTNPVIDNPDNYTNLAEFITSDNRYFSLLDDKKKLSDIASQLDVSFYNLDPDPSITPDDCTRFVYKGGLYMVNNHMLQMIIETCFKDDYQILEYQKKNYSYIKTIDKDKLLKKIQENSNDYCEKVLLIETQSIEDSEENFCELIQLPGLTDENKKRLIDKRKIKVNDIRLISDQMILEYMLFKKGFKATWPNLIYIFDTIGEDHDYATFINAYYNELDHYIETTEKEKASVEFCNFLYNNIELNNQAYRIICKNTSQFYNDYNFNLLSDSKVIIIIEEEALAELIESYTVLKNHKKILGYHYLALTESLWDENMESLFNNENELFEFLKKALELEVEIFPMIFSNYKHEYFKASQTQFLISELLSKEMKPDFQDGFVIDMLENNVFKFIGDSTRIEYLHIYKRLFSNENLNKFIENMSDEYSVLLNTGRKPKIPANSSNEVLLQILKEKSFISSFQSDGKDMFKIYFRRA